MSVRVLTEKEALARRTEVFAKLKADQLFSIGRGRHYIAVEKVGEKEWRAVALTDVNRARITAGKAPEITTLHFEDMRALNLYEWGEGS